MVKRDRLQTYFLYCVHTETQALCSRTIDHNTFAGGNPGRAGQIVLYGNLVNNTRTYSAEHFS